MEGRISVLKRARAADKEVGRSGAPKFFENASLRILIHGDGSFVGQGIVDTMLQDIATGKDLEQAWHEAAIKMEQAVDTWKSMHPTWKLEGCK